MSTGVRIVQKMTSDHLSWDMSGHKLPSAYCEPEVRTLNHKGVSLALTPTFFIFKTFKIRVFSTFYLKWLQPGELHDREWGCAHRTRKQITLHAAGG